MRVWRKCLLSPISRSLRPRGAIAFQASSNHDAWEGFKDAAVHPDFITESEHSALMADLDKVFRRKRFMGDHWDDVIVHYKESERPDGTWSPESQAAIDRVRAAPVFAPNLGPWLPCHAIDLAPEGFIKPHVDSVKFSGRVVAGLSLVSAAVMRLRRCAAAGENTLSVSAPAPPPGQQPLRPPGQPEKSIDSASDRSGGTAAGKEKEDGEFFDLVLLPRSLYVLQGAARYKCTHEILPHDGLPLRLNGGRTAHPRGRRLSIIFRDAFVPPPP